MFEHTGPLSMCCYAQCKIHTLDFQGDTVRQIGWLLLNHRALGLWNSFNTVVQTLLFNKDLLWNKESSDLTCVDVLPVEKVNHRKDRSAYPTRVLGNIRRLDHGGFWQLPLGEPFCDLVGDNNPQHQQHNTSRCDSNDWVYEMFVSSRRTFMRNQRNTWKKNTWRQTHYVFVNLRLVLLFKNLI